MTKRQHNYYDSRGFMPRADRVDRRMDWVHPNGDFGPNKTRHEAPYSYSPFFHWREPKHEDGTNAVYSDRMYQWKPERMREADKLFNKRFEQMTREEIDKYATFYFEKPTHVTALAEGCNVGNGYPYYIIWYREL